jgi:hypothetical protein
MIARCEDCGLVYGVDYAGVPETQEAFTCDDCGGYVDVDKETE